MADSPSDVPGFDPDGPGQEGLFGIPAPQDACRVQILPVPWEATASYGRGTRGGPDAIRAASVQVDLHDLEYGEFWKEGIYLLSPPEGIEEWSDAAEPDAQAVIAAGGGRPEEAGRVDALAERVNEAVYQESKRILAEGRIPAVIGGDHSVPYGLMKAVSEAFPGVGVLHIDAHLDLRDAYLGFRWSHASIFYNVLQLPGIGRIVAVAQRDVGGAEVALSRQDPRHQTFYDPDLAMRLAEGATWKRLCEGIIAALPPQVHVSFDIDGLDPALCPDTGTPVPGGLSFHQAQVLLRLLSERRRIVGFDLCEVAPSPDSEWNANVGARLLFKLCGAALASGAGRASGQGAT